MNTEISATEDAGGVAGQVSSDAEELGEFGVKDIPWASIISGVSTMGFQNEVKADLKKILQNQELIIGALKKIETEIKWTALVEEVTPSVTGIQSLWQQMMALGAEHDPSWTEETLEQEKKRWIKAVLDDDNGVTPALTLIANVAKGTVPLSGSQKGMIETFFEKVDDQEKDKKDKAVYLNVYHHCRAYLGQLFMIQFMGTVMLVNAYLARGEKGPAGTAVDSLTANLKAQTGLMSKVTPHLLKSLAALPGKHDRFKARFLNRKTGRFVYAAKLGLVGMRKTKNKKTELWVAEPVNHTKSEFYIWSAAHGSGSKIRDGDSFSDEDYPLRYRDQGRHPHKWRFIPSKDRKGYFLIVTGANKSMLAEQNLAFLSDKFRDNSDTQWKPEFEDEAPVVYP